MESINVLGHDTAGILLINAMSQCLKTDGNLIELYAPEKGVVQVELKINGNVVPFVDSLNEAWERLTSLNNQRIAKAAEELVNAAGAQQLEQITKAVTHARDTVKRRLVSMLPPGSYEEDD